MVSVQTLPTSAEAYQAAQRAEITSALAAVERQWLALSGVAWWVAWNDVVAAQVLAIILTAQGRVSGPTGAYVSDVLQETGLGRLDDPAASVARRPLVGVAGDGRSVEGLLSVTEDKVSTALAAGSSPTQALSQGWTFLNVATATVLSDTARQMEALHTAVRPVTTYVRMLNPPSCSRCAILAGRKYKMVEAFDRHPGCDCRHIPSAESVAGDQTVDPAAYFDSLSKAEQDRIFTKAGAEAIRNGADPARVVNARRGMSTAQPKVTTVSTTPAQSFELLGKPLYTAPATPQTVTETTRRRLVRDADGFFSTTEGMSRSSGVRLMPESIVELAAGDRSRMLTMLRSNGYIT